MTDLKVGGEFAGKYKLEERIGEGKFKETWKAEDAIMKRTVALKTFQEQNDNIDELIREASNQTKLGKHPNIVQIYDASKDPITGYSFISEEFKEGETLEEISKKGLTEKEIMDILIQLSDGLAYAHKKGIIHRDLKPSNILMKGKTPIITDWGGSSESGIKHIPVDGVHGSILFRSPEALDGSTDPKVDTYALGVLSYWLFTKEFPFTGNSYEEIKDKIINLEPKKLSEYMFSTKISRKFEKIIMRQLSKNPKKRYSAKKLRRKLWLHRNRKKIAAMAAAMTGIAITVTPILSMIGLLGTLNTIGMFKSITLPKTDLKIIYLNSKKLKYTESIHPCRKDSDSNVRITMRNLFPDSMETYIRRGNKIFAVTKKDIYMYSIENIEPKGIRYGETRITETPDQEETNIQLSPNGNFLAYMTGRNLHVIRTDSKFERTVLENIDEYMWNTLQEKITYRKGNTIYITDLQEAPFAEQKARKIVEGIYPKWTDDSSYLFYFIKNENETSICVKECGSPDFITGTKKLSGWKFSVDKSVQEFFLSHNRQVVADKFSLAYFVPKKQQLIVIKGKLDKTIHPAVYPVRNFQDIRQIVFNPDLDGILFSGKLLQEQDYEIFYYHLNPLRKIRLTNNQEDDTNPMFFSYKSPN
ncbi:serine/threonine protein kinase [Candidatus Woesearchaeota archaeon]|nr:serine/threonine protein kinase [Candidatus Woesearchaeota archaeon]